MEFESVQVKKKNKKELPFGYKLMAADWLTEIPEDFSNDWLIKMCPEGVRDLVVANEVFLGNILGCLIRIIIGDHYMLLKEW